MRVQVTQTPALLLWALLAAACSSSAGSADMSTGDGAGLRDCTGCRTDQVCSDGTCLDVPSKCPCPKETFCDLTSGTCQRGCTDDVNCSAGKFCDTGPRLCVAGCQLDTHCSAGFICQSQQCVAGCRKDATCGGSGKICDAATAMCRPGCRVSADCTGAGQICDSGTAKCIPGCTKKADCAAGKTCDVTFGRCVPQCAAGDAKNCADNESCIQQPDTTYGCSAYCRGHECKNPDYVCLGDRGKVNELRCRMLCRDFGQGSCAAGETCTVFVTEGSTGMYCAKKCAVAGCDMAIPRTGPTCSCSMTTNLCMDTRETFLPCSQPDPGYGL